MNSGTTVVVMTLALGFIAGVLSGMFGIGGGLVIVPALVIFFGIPMKTATGTSLFALLWPVGLLGVIEYWRNDKLDAWRGLWIAVGLFLGAYLGARITLAISPAAMKRAYAIFLLAVGAYFLLTVRTDPAPGPEIEVAPAPAPAPGTTQVH